MMDNSRKDTKLYYSINEVAKIVGVSASTLRFWEKEFPQLKPKTNPLNKVRQYTQEDIELVKNIYSLVKVRGFKLAAAKRLLSANRESVERSSEILQTLMSVRDELKELRIQMGGMA